MIIGVDFDNTIVCYDELFHREAMLRNLIPAETPPIKEAVRNCLRQLDREESWTELQGHVYGTVIDDAPRFPGVIEFFADCKRKGVGVCIISHRTRKPYLGEDVDLHQAARRWLRKQGIEADVFLEETKEAKFQRIARQSCSHFIDDLPEFLLDKDFPSGIERILFDPHRKHSQRTDLARAESWTEITNRFFTKNPCCE